MTTETLLSIEQVRATLPVRKSRRWIIRFLKRTGTDLAGRPLYRKAGRDLVVYYERFIEALPGPREPFRAKRLPVRKDGWRQAPTRNSREAWAELAELTGDPSLASYGNGSTRNRKSGN